MLSPEHRHLPAHAPSGGRWHQLKIYKVFQKTRHVWLPLNGTGIGRSRLRGHRCLAPLSGLDYVTPSLVAIAARKVYPHRIILTVPERDRSLQYGSELAAVKAMLEGVTPEVVIEDVLTAVEAPL